MPSEAMGYGFSDSDDDVIDTSSTQQDEESRVRRKRVLPETDEEDSSSQSDSDEDTAPREVMPINIRRRHPRQQQLRRQGSDHDTGVAIAAIQLANEVEALRRRRDELMSLHIGRLLNSGRRDFLVTTALEYYDIFSNGFMAPRLPGIFQYMNARIDRDNFAYGATGLNMDTWVEQWHRYMRIFPSIGIRVRATSCMHLIDPLDAASLIASDASTTTCMVEAHGTMTGVISRQAIDTLLPHLRHREDLVHKLLGKPLDCPITLRFYFNGTGRVIRLDSDADFFQAFSNVADVGLFEVMHMMEQVTVRDSSLLPEVVGDENEERVLEEEKS